MTLGLTEEAIIHHEGRGGNKHAKHKKTGASLLGPLGHTSRDGAEMRCRTLLVLRESLPDASPQFL